MWKTSVEPDSPQMTKRRMRIPRWITKAIETQLEYLILTAISRQQWLHEGASHLRYT